MKHVLFALGMHCEGISLNDIAKELNILYGYDYSDSTIYEWLLRFTREGIAITEKLVPDVGRTWVTFERKIKVANNEKFWLQDIVDCKSHFLIESQIIPSINISSTKELLEEASRRARVLPEIIISSKLPAYISGIDFAFGSATKHVVRDQVMSDQGKVINYIDEKLKHKVKIIKSSRSLVNGNLFSKGWEVYYNFFKTQDILGNKTPAEIAGIALPFKNVLRYGTTVAMQQISGLIINV